MSRPIPVIGGPEEGLVSWVEEESPEPLVDDEREPPCSSLRALLMGALVAGLMALVFYAAWFAAHDLSPAWWQSGATLSGGR